MAAPRLGEARSFRRPAGKALLAGALLGALAAPAGAAAGGGEPAADARVEFERLARDNELLRKRVELASGKEFYLLLDPSASRLKLMLQGAVLQDYRVQSIEVGAPRVVFVRRTLPEGWRGRIWTAGNLVPVRDRERFELEAPPPSNDPNAEEPTIPIPPTPEEAYPVPHRYHVRFQGGLSLEVRRQGDVEDDAGFWQGLRTSLATWWADLQSALHPGAPDADSVRVRLTLLPKDADSLYRALPPDTRLLVLPEPG